MFVMRSVLSSRRADKDDAEGLVELGGVSRTSRRLALASCLCSLLGALCGLVILALVLVWSVRTAAGDQRLLPSL